MREFLEFESTLSFDTTTRSQDQIKEATTQKIINNRGKKRNLSSPEPVLGKFLPTSYPYYFVRWLSRVFCAMVDQLETTESGYNVPLNFFVRSLVALVSSIPIVIGLVPALLGEMFGKERNVKSSNFPYRLLKRCHVMGSGILGVVPHIISVVPRMLIAAIRWLIQNVMTKEGTNPYIHSVTGTPTPQGSMEISSSVGPHTPNSDASSSSKRSHEANDNEQKDSPRGPG